MPNYKGHLVGGIITYFIVLCMVMPCIPSFITGFEWLLCILAGALFPDVDIKSKGQKYFYHLILVIFLFLAWQRLFVELSCFSIIAITPMLARHRGIFHNMWFIVGLAFGVWSFLSIMYPLVARPLLINTLFFVLGAFSHIFLDRYIDRVFH